MLSKDTLDKMAELSIKGYIGSGAVKDVMARLVIDRMGAGNIKVLRFDYKDQLGIVHSLSIKDDCITDLVQSHNSVEFIEFNIGVLSKESKDA